LPPPVGEWQSERFVLPTNTTTPSHWPAPDTPLGDPDTGDVRLRTEIIASEVIFLGGIQQSNLPPAYAFELEELPDIGGADDETNAQADQGLSET
jgi:hypothetical protein